MLYTTRLNQVPLPAYKTHEEMTTYIPGLWRPTHIIYVRMCYSKDRTSALREDTHRYPPTTTLFVSSYPFLFPHKFLQFLGSSANGGWDGLRGWDGIHLNNTSSLYWLCTCGCSILNAKFMWVGKHFTIFFPHSTGHRAGLATRSTQSVYSSAPPARFMTCTT